MSIHGFHGFVLHSNSLHSSTSVMSTAILKLYTNIPTQTQTSIITTRMTRNECIYICMESRSELNNLGAPDPSERHDGYMTPGMDIYDITD